MGKEPRGSSRGGIWGERNWNDSESERVIVASNERDFYKSKEGFDKGIESMNWTGRIGMVQRQFIHLPTIAGFEKAAHLYDFAPVKLGF